MTDELQDHIGYHFRDKELLKLALTHPSVLNAKSNQRLEFLGDAILGAVIAKMVYERFPNEKEGELARRQAALVRGETLTQIALTIKLGDALHIGTSEIQSEGRKNASNLEDALEALLGGIYLDGGIEAVEHFIIPRWQGMCEKCKPHLKMLKLPCKNGHSRGVCPCLYIVWLKLLALPTHLSLLLKLPYRGINLNEPKQRPSGSLNMQLHFY